VGKKAGYPVAILIPLYVYGILLVVSYIVGKVEFVIPDFTNQEVQYSFFPFIPLLLIAVFSKEIEYGAICYRNFSNSVGENIAFNYWHCCRGAQYTNDVFKFDHC
jgi:hypothetical protein